MAICCSEFSSVSVLLHYAELMVSRAVACAVTFDDERKRLHGRTHDRVARMSACTMTFNEPMLELSTVGRKGKPH